MRIVILVLVIAGLLVGALLGFQWWRIDTAVGGLESVQDYLFNTTGLSASLAFVLAAVVFVGVLLATGIVLLRPALLLMAAAVVLCVGLATSPLIEKQSLNNCFNRRTEAPLCERWQSPEGCEIIRKDGARPPAHWRFLRLATHEDVQACWGATTPEQREARAPQAVAVDSCSRPGLRLFDATGVALYYYSQEGESIQLWNQPGFHPLTRVPLKPLDAETSKFFCEQLDRAARERSQTVIVEEAQEKATREREIAEAAVQEAARAEAATALAETARIQRELETREQEIARLKQQFDRTPQSTLPPQTPAQLREEPADRQTAERTVRLPAPTPIPAPQSPLDPYSRIVVR